MTPAYWLTRLVWWFPSRVAAAIGVGALSGLCLAALAAMGLVPPGLRSRDVDVTTFVIAFGIGSLAAAISTSITRGHWQEGEALSRSARGAIVRSVQLGEDIGDPGLAAITQRFAADARARIEGEPRSLLGNALAILGAQIGFGMATLLARGEWFGASLGVLVTMALLWSGWRTYRSRPESQARAWYAEWYAAQRLAGTA